MKGLLKATKDHGRGEGRLTRHKMLHDNRFATADLREYYRTYCIKETISLSQARLHEEAVGQTPADECPWLRIS